MRAAAGSDLTGGPERSSDFAEAAPSAPAVARPKAWLLKRGHALSYAGLFLFTFVLYFRPYELFPSLSFLSTSAFWIALCTLIIYVPSQLAVEGNLTVWTREIKLVLLLCLFGLLSIPLADNPAEAWETFNDSFIKAVVMFIVIVNVVRTRRRLQGLIFLSLAVSYVLCVNALNDYRLGNLTIEGYRVKGLIGNLFDNPNDLALHLVTVTPIAFVLMLNARSVLLKMFYGACALLTVAGNVVTYSRAGFLGLMAIVGVMAWKLGRRNRLAVAAAALFFVVGFMALAPGNYALRIVSMFDRSLDPLGSADTRQEILNISVKVALRNPWGIGMGNFRHRSIQELVTHNAYTQVASEMGLVALVVYIMFMITPFRRLRMIEDATFKQRRKSRFFYLSVGLQASLIGYMVTSFFAAVAYLWYVYYIVGYSIAVRRMYEAEHGPVLGAAVKTEPRTGVDKAVDGNGAPLLEPAASSGRL